MGDIYVHMRMKECCRSTLKALDTHKKKAKHRGGVLGVKSLHTALADKTIDDAKEAIPGGMSELLGQIEQLTLTMCATLCKQHADQHEGKGEKEEGAFWHDLGAAIKGKPRKKAAAPTTPGAHGLHKGRLYVAYADGVKLGGSRSWRNNNPGNIVAGKFATSHGAIGSDGHFAIFPDEKTGHAALSGLLQGDSYKNLSIADAMAKYAPPSENDTKGYVAAVSKATGLDATKTVGVLEEKEMGAFTAAIQQHEGWKIGGSVAPGVRW